jgi:hypothetical protein
VAFYLCILKKSSIHVVKASNFESHGNFGPVLIARSIASLGVCACLCVDRTELARLNCLYNFYFLYFFVGRVLKVTSASEEKKSTEFT